jgi:hypothetical protein
MPNDSPTWRSNNTKSLNAIIVSRTLDINSHQKFCELHLNLIRDHFTVRLTALKCRITMAVETNFPPSLDSIGSRKRAKERNLTIDYRLNRQLRLSLCEVSATTKHLRCVSGENASIKKESRIRLRLDSLFLCFRQKNHHNNGHSVMFFGSFGERSFLFLHYLSFLLEHLFYGGF